MHITTWLFNSVKCCDWRARWNSVFMSPFRMRAHPAMAVLLFLFLFFFSSLIKLFYHLVTSRFNCIDSCDFLSFYQLPLFFSWLHYTQLVTPLWVPLTLSSLSWKSKKNWRKDLLSPLWPINSTFNPMLFGVSKL